MNGWLMFQLMKKTSADDRLPNLNICFYYILISFFTILVAGSKDDDVGLYAELQGTFK